MSSLNCIESGKGESVVFLHGFCETSDIWADIQKQLSEEYHVISIDLPGFGGSTLPGSQFSLSDIARKIKSCLDEHNVHQYVMIGHSLGGYIALAFARLYQENLRGLGLFHSSVFTDSVEKMEIRNKLIDFVKKNGVRLFIKTFVPSLFYDKNLPQISQIVERLKIKAAKTQANSVIEYARAMRDRKSSVDLVRSIKIPVMFIIGEKDESVPLDKSLEQATLPYNSHILKLSETGHMGMYEKPDEAYSFIEKFLRFC